MKSSRSNKTKTVILEWGKLFSFHYKIHPIYLYTEKYNSTNRNRKNCKTSIITNSIARAFYLNI